LATDATWLQAFAFIAGALVAAYFPRSTFAAALPLARVLAHPISP
jgi:hypothetical protein